MLLLSSNMTQHRAGIWLSPSQLSGAQVEISAGPRRVHGGAGEGEKPRFLLGRILNGLLRPAAPSASHGEYVPDCLMGVPPRGDLTLRLMNEYRNGRIITRDCGPFAIIKNSMRPG